MYRKSIIIGCLVLGLFAGLGLTLGNAPVDQTKGFDFTLNDLAGKSHALSNYKGKIIFLNFWATWCPPCRQEMPAMQKMFESWDKNKYVMLAVNTGEDKRTVKEFAQKNGYTFPIPLDKDGKIARTYQITGIPTTFIVDGDGKIITKIVGSREWTMKDIEYLIQ